MTDETLQTPDTDDDTVVDTSITEAPDDEQADTFSREYVEKLRDSEAKYRLRAKEADDHAARADALAHQLHHALAQADGRLLDPTDLPFRVENIESPEAMTAAIGALLEDKPHLANRRPKGDAGQGVRGDAENPVSILSILRSRA